jgi:6-phosphogluconolactonase
MVIIHPTADDVAHAVATLMEDAIAGTSDITVGLAGGSTPSAAYRLLADRPVDWDRVTFWLGDERWVPDTHPECNALMVRTTLGPGADRLIAPDHGIGDPEKAAAAYSDRLASSFSPSGGRPGLVLLGMGDDGHTASLFPGTDALEVVDRDYAAVWVEGKATWRLTATLPLLWSARHIVFVVTGDHKADMIRRVVGDGEPLPAQRVAAGAESVTWMLDEAAAAHLSGT